MFDPKVLKKLKCATLAFNGAKFCKKATKKFAESFFLSSEQNFAFLNKKYR